MAIIDQKITDKYAIYNGDCCEVLPRIKSESIHFTVYSPPFAELYNYSSSDNDLSNCDSYEQFLEHYRFVIDQIHRITMPGRLSAIHCMDIAKKGDASLRDFPGDIIRLHEDAGFVFHARYAIWKEPLRVAIRTRAKGLMHRQIVADSSLCGVAGADYIIVMRKKGQNPEPIVHPEGLTHYAGEDGPPDEMVAKYGHGWDEPKTNKMSHWIWQRYASSFWTDIRIGNVLPYRYARESDEEKHVCPLQLDVIERCVTLWSNPGDKILTPFLGVGSEVYSALKLGRKGIGIELKPSYFNQAVNNILMAQQDESIQESFVLDDSTGDDLSIME